MPHVGLLTIGAASAQRALENLDGVPLARHHMLEKVLGRFAIGVLIIGRYGRDEGIERLSLHARWWHS